MKRIKTLGLLGGGAAFVMCTVLVATTTSGAPTSTRMPAASATSYAAAIYDQKTAEGANEASLAFDLALSRYESGQGTLDDAISWGEKARSAHYTPTAAAEYRDRLIKVEKAVQKRVAAGTATSLDTHAIAYHRALAEASTP